MSKEVIQNSQELQSSDPQTTKDLEVYTSKYRRPYVSPTPGEMPLIAIGSIKYSKGGSPSEKTIICDQFPEQYLSLINECGFNGVQAMIGRSHVVESSLRNCEKAGLKHIVRTSGLTHNVLDCSKYADLSPANQEKECDDHLNSTLDYTKDGEPVNDHGKRYNDVCYTWKRLIGHDDIKETNDDPQTSPQKKFVWKSEACGGLQLDDEPILRMFPRFGQLKDTLLDTDKWGTTTFINLLPQHVEGILNGDGVGNMAGCKQRHYATGDPENPLATLPEYNEFNPGKAYQIYLDEYERIFHPNVWVYDGYFTHEVPPDLSQDQRQYSFFDSLEAIRKQAIKTNRPFWANVKCLYYRGVSTTTASFEGSTWDIPEEYAKRLSTYMNIEARCYLTAGAKGLMFWAVMARPDEPLGDYQFHWGPLRYDCSLNGNSSNDNPEPAEAVKTVLFKPLKDLISDIKKFEKLFLCSTVDDTYRYDPAPGSGTEIWKFKPAILSMAGEAYMAHHTTEDGEFIVVVNTELDIPVDSKGHKQVRKVILESDVQWTELTGRGALDVHLGNMRPADLGGDIPPSVIEGPEDRFTLQPDPNGKLKVGAYIEPGDWRIFYRRTKQN